MFAIEVSIKINVYVLTQNRSTGYLVSHRFNFGRFPTILLKVDLAVHSLLSFPCKYYVGTLVN